MMPSSWVDCVEATFRTADEGDSWTVIEKPQTSSIVAVIRLPDDRLIAAGAAGEILISTDNGFSFSSVPGRFLLGP